MSSNEPTSTYDEVVLPHLDAARRLARRIMRDEHDAEDAVQDASLRALRYFSTFGGGDGRAWFLRIVRNTCYGWRRKGLQAPTALFDEERHSSAEPQSDPEALLLKTDAATSIAQALSRLPDPFHQLLVLRELEGLSYRELADVVGIPIGTVMSRLSRARVALRGALGGSPASSGRIIAHANPDSSRYRRRADRGTARASDVASAGRRPAVSVEVGS